MRKNIALIILIIFITNSCIKNTNKTLTDIKISSDSVFPIFDSVFIYNIKDYVELKNKNNTTKIKNHFWELYVLQADQFYAKILIKNCNYELLSTATGYFTIGKDVFFLHTGLELIAEKDTSFVYNVVKANTKAKYKLIDKFTIPKTDSTMNREFILIADTIIINYQN